MANKYLALVAGRLKEVFGLVTSSGAGDAGKIPALDSSGKLDVSLLPSGLGPSTKSIAASEDLSAGNLVNVWNDAGTVKVRKADATAVGKEANGYVLAGVTSGNNATVYFDDELTGLTSLTPGARYYLSAATPGGIVSTPPSTTGNVVQFVGVAVSTTSIVFEAGEPVELA
jgi:hypothetical protein